MWRLWDDEKSNNEIWKTTTTTLVAKRFAAQDNFPSVLAYTTLTVRVFLAIPMRKANYQAFFEILGALIISGIVMTSLSLSVRVTLDFFLVRARVIHTPRYQVMFVCDPRLQSF